MAAALSRYGIAWTFAGRQGGRATHHTTREEAMSKRSNGEGSIRRRSDRGGRWEARYFIEVDGAWVRRSLFAPTKELVAQRMRAAMAARDAGTHPVPARETVGTYVDSPGSGGRRSHVCSHIRCSGFIAICSNPAAQLRRSGTRTASCIVRSTKRCAGASSPPMSPTSSTHRGSHGER